MFSKTSSIPFLKFGEVYNELPESNENILYADHQMILESPRFNCMYQVSDPCYLKVTDGIAMLVITDDLNREWQEFVVHRIVKISKGMYFNLIPLGSSAQFLLRTSSNSLITTQFLPVPYSRKRIRSSIHVKELVAYFYNVRGHNYSYPGGTEHYWELTYVDSGVLFTQINGKDFTLKHNEFILYAPGDYVRQSTGEQACSYLTIMFVMDLENDSANSIKNRVSSLDTEMRRDLDSFVRNKRSPYFNELLLNSLQHFIISILREPEESSKSVSSPMQQKFENELLDEILLYINENIYSSFNVEDLCKEFALSRSTLQTLFTSNLGIAPKQYISNIKLRKSRILIKESKYTISEIASMLGYSSIHYFSRKFKNEFGMTPSEYANKLLD